MLKIPKLLRDSTVWNFLTKKCVKVNDLSSGQYSVNKNKSFKTSMLRSNLCDYRDAYIVVKTKMIKLKEMLHLKIMLLLDNVFQKLTTHW